MISVRRLLIGLAFAFTAYLAVRGLWWTGPFTEPLVLVAAVALYVVTTGVALLWGNRDPEDDDVTPDAPGLAPRASSDRMPLAAALMALGTTVVVPNALSLAVPREAIEEPYVVWYLGGIGALMALS